MKKLVKKAEAKTVSSFSICKTCNCKKITCWIKKGGGSAGTNAMNTAMTNEAHYK